MHESTIVILQSIVAICGGFSCVCVAVGWLIKIVKGVKKPADDVNEKLKRDYDRLNKLDEDMLTIKLFMSNLQEGFAFLLENDMVGFEHMRTNNATGKIAKQEEQIHEYLLKMSKKEIK